MDLVQDAWACADEAAGRVDVCVAELSRPADLEDASVLLQRVWRAGHPAEVAAASLLRTYAHSGNYVAGAYRDGHLIGVAAGFFGLPHGHPHLHSYVAGVSPGRLGKGVGFALKQHQRAWTLARGVPEVHWTYDPLILRNAYFNLQKLGAAVTGYLPEFYGAMADGINSGDLSDRLYVVWRLDAPRVAAAAHGSPAEVSTEGAVPLVAAGPDGAPVESTVDADRVCVAVPEDAEAVRQRDPATALRWRHAVRTALSGRLAAGWRIDGITRDGRYVLERSGG
ncbi:GNAT family N-acetyltransferase [Dactylosporangium roseum]|uniref:GNAT family N-acetyltransferase n=1 Tax=Dactylosporangium roseum TaxID=47989 RepID=A0ABY5YZD5_9ACTN|nr:GNAT family N-acetyltransferase [Dactylosporangium roseum]UWZ34892.1 GNAT family N-acetyltransferase [Dactylosporangium roseum]